ncbi:MAG: hypothetical protein PHQ81_02415 [Methanofollis sp.]|nr:hypothetical protein [Methanofollis sp.]
MIKKEFKNTGNRRFPVKKEYKIFFGAREIENFPDRKIFEV